MSETTRRGVLAGAAGVGAAAVLAACGTSTGNSDTGSGSGGAQSQPTGGAQGGAGGSNAGGGSAIAQTSEIPVGSGKIFADKQVVVTQPRSGVFKAFSNVCTHQGCPVSTVSDGTINCPCHHSRFSIADGSVQGGPAPAPLPAKNVTVQGTNIVVA